MLIFNFESGVWSRARLAGWQGWTYGGVCDGTQECLIFGRTNAARWDGSADRAGYDLSRMGWGWVGWYAITGGAYVASSRSLGMASNAVVAGYSEANEVVRAHIPQTVLGHGRRTGFETAN
jgi:hypothetical protein